MPLGFSKSLIVATFVRCLNSALLLSGGGVSAITSTVVSGMFSRAGISFFKVSALFELRKFLRTTKRLSARKGAELIAPAISSTDDCLPSRVSRLVSSYFSINSERQRWSSFCSEKLSSPCMNTRFGLLMRLV